MLPSSRGTDMIAAICRQREARADARIDAGFPAALALARQPRHRHVECIGEVHVHDTPDDVIFDWFQEAAFPDQEMGRPV